MADRVFAAGRAVGGEAARAAVFAVLRVFGEVDFAAVRGVRVAVAEARRTLADAAHAVVTPRSAVAGVAHVAAAATVLYVLGEVALTADPTGSEAAW